MHAAIARIDALVEQAFDGLDVEGFRTRFVQAARKDLAGQALSDAEGYARKVQTFTDLTRAELAYVEAWIASVDLPAELTRLTWLPAPAPQRIVRLLKETPKSKLPPSTVEALMQQFIIAATDQLD